MSKKIKPCLWLDNRVEEAVEFYTSVFNDSEVLSINKMPDGNTMTAEFRLFDETFMLLNGGPMFNFTEAVSFFIECQDQAEVDYYWDTLSEGGETSQCGWTKDKFGLSWQVVPVRMMELLGDPDGEKAERVMAEMMKMTKIEVDKLETAYAGE